MSAKCHEQTQYDLGQYHLALICAAEQCACVVQGLVHVRAAATSAFVFASATGIFVRVFLEVRTLLPALVSLVSTFKGVTAGSAGLPPLVRHVLVLPHAILSELRCGRIIGDADASLDKIGHLVSLFRLRLSPLVVHAGDGASHVHCLTSVPHSIAKN